jgi:hypothetical protein
MAKKQNRCFILCYEILAPPRKMNFFFSFPSCPSSLHLLPTCPFPLYFPVFRVRICRILCFRLGLPSQLIFFRTSSSKDVHVGLKISFSITPLYEFVLMGPEEGQYYCALVSLVCFFLFSVMFSLYMCIKPSKRKEHFFYVRISLFFINNVVFLKLWLLTIADR